MTQYAEKGDGYFLLSPLMKHGALSYGIILKSIGEVQEMLFHLPFERPETFHTLISQKQKEALSAIHCSNLLTGPSKPFL